MKTRHAVLATAVLGLLTLQSVIGLGLGHGLSPRVQAVLWGTALSTAGGLAAGLGRRPRLALGAWSVAAVLLGLLQFGFERGLAASRDRDAELARQVNQRLLAAALARVPCSNGDIATLQVLNNPGTDRYSMSIQVVPADASRPGQWLVSTSGQFMPPDDAALRAWRARTGADCRSPEGASLDTLMDRLRAHYAAERPKYAN